MEAIIGVFMILFALVAGGKVRDSNKQSAQERRTQARRNNPCIRKGDGRGTQNNASYHRIPSGPVRR